MWADPWEVTSIEAGVPTAEAAHLSQPDLLVREASNHII